MSTGKIDNYFAGSPAHAKYLSDVSYMEDDANMNKSKGCNRAILCDVSVHAWKMMPVNIGNSNSV